MSDEELIRQMEELDKCPFCNGGKIGESWWGFQYDCLSIKSPNGELTITGECKDRQISNLKERLEAWKEYGKYTIDIFGYSIETEKTYQKLKDLGEI